MAPFHARLARIALAAAEPYGFALAGGYAMQAHGFLDRPSADVDIFTPSRLSIGPVLHPGDAIANKVCALFGRAEVRDYVDVDAIVSSGRYREEELLLLAESHDPGLRQAVVRRGPGRRRPTARRPVPAL